MRIALMVGLFAFGAFAGDMLNGAGATFPYPLYSKWASDYGKVTGTQLNYQSIGSGGGIQQIKARTVDFGASDEPQKPEMLTSSNLIQFPAVVGGVVLVVNLAGVKEGQLKLDSDTLCQILLGNITKWTDPKIQKLNPDIKFPDLDITTVHRSDGSGTNAIFTHYLSEVCVEWKTKVGEGKLVVWPVGIGGKGNEGVSQYSKRTEGSLGYVEFAFAKQNNINYAQLQNRAGNFVSPSIEAFQAAALSGDFDASKSFYAWLTNAPGKDAWPIAGATFILLPKEEEKLATSKNVVKFFDWAFKNGDKAAEALFYVPLPRALKDKIVADWMAHKVK